MTYSIGDTDRLVKVLERIAAALERAYPVPALTKQAAIENFTRREQA